MAAKVRAYHFWFLATGFWFLVPGFWFLVPWLRANFRQIPKDNNSVRRWTAFR
jgi:hypothetical protein